MRTWSSIGRILLAPLQQRAWPHPAVLPVATLLLLGLVPRGRGDGLPPGAGAALTLAGVGLGGTALALLWAGVVTDLLHRLDTPDAARLVPGYTRRLRLALLVAAAAVVALAAALLGLPFGTPWTTAVATAAALALVVAGVRWPLPSIAVAVVGALLALAMPRAMDIALLHLAVRGWRHAASVTGLVVLLLSAVLAAAAVRDGGAAHRRQAAAWRAGRSRLQSGLVVETPPGGGHGGLRSPGPACYDLWFAHVLRRRSAPIDRAMLALGPALHWAGQAGSVAWTFGLLAVLLAGWRIVAPASSSGFENGAAIGLVFVLAIPVLQGRPGWHRRRAEQALLRLVPGVPQRGRFNRALAGRMLAAWSATLLFAWVASIGLLAFARSTGSGAMAPVVTPWTMVLACLPLAPGLVPRFDRLRPPTSGSTVLLALVPPILFGLNACVDTLAPASVPVLAGLELALPAALVAWRWRRMGREPAAWPVGRNARVRD